MINLQQRSYQPELLDKDDIPFEDIVQNMRELNTINTWLGGHNITVSGIKQLLSQQHKAAITICEIGCGGGDNLQAIYQYCSRKNIVVTFIGIDSKPACIEFAKQQYPQLPCNWISSRYEEVDFDTKPDIIFSSLFCHHFTEESLRSMLCWMKVNSSKGFIINDLHRHALAYYSIKFITGLLSKSYLVKNDAPLSVARGFTKDEWQTLFKQAGLNNHISIQWKWAFRHLIIYQHD